MFQGAKKVVVLAPHPDDAELGAGGTIAKLTESGIEVHVIVFTNYSERVSEMKMAAKILSIRRIYQVGCKPHRVGDHRQKVLNKLIDLRQKIQPDIVIQPTLSDLHQDHQVVAAEGIRAFKPRTILGYESAWNIPTFESHFYSSLTIGQVDKRVAAVLCYQSQSHKPYINEEFLRGLAKVRGVRGGCDYAEAFSVIRAIA